MRHTIITLLALTITLAACVPVIASSPTATAAPSATLDPTVTATPIEAPTATEATTAPTMESLPAEWQGKIDHIETMTNMDGKTTRVVAVESLTDEDKVAGKTEAKFRVLQWDGKEWVSYVPQVGWAGYQRDDIWFNLWKNPDILLPDRNTLTDQLAFNDGSEIPLGVIGYTYKKGSETDKKYFLQGYILSIESFSNVSTNEDWTAVRIGVPLQTGDWQIIVYGLAKGDVIANIFSLSSFSPDSLNKPNSESGILADKLATFTQLTDYFNNHKDKLIGLPIVTKIDQMKKLDDPKRYSYDQVVSLIQAMEVGNPIDCPNILPILAPFFVTDEMYSQIIGQ